MKTDGWLLRPRGLTAAACLVVLTGLGSAARCAALEVTVWTLDRLDFAGDVPVEVVGKPKVAKLDGATVVRFDGAADGLIVPVVPIAGMAAFTIEAWFRPEAGGGEEQRFFHTEDAAAARGLLEIRMTPDGRWALDTFLFSGDSSLALLDRSKLHPADGWHWVALSYDGKTMRSFVDGALELQGDVAIPPMKPAGKTSLGVRQNRVSWFKGSLRELRFHPAALAPGKLQR